MTLVKKINDLWQPSEKPNLAIGETLEVTDYESLVRGGMAVLVDATGSEIELPGQKFTCPICFSVSEGLSSFYDHIATHLQKNKETMEAALKAIPEQKPEEKVEVKSAAEALKEEVAAEVVKQNKAEEAKAKRVAALAKARAAKKAKIKEL